MGKYIGSKVVKAEPKTNTFTKKGKDGAKDEKVVENIFSSPFVDAGNRSILVNVTRAIDASGKEIDLTRVASFDIKVVTFENNGGAL